MCSSSFPSKSPFGLFIVQVLPGCADKEGAEVAPHFRFIWLYSPTAAMKGSAWGKLPDSLSIPRCFWSFGRAEVAVKKFRIFLCLFLLSLVFYWFLQRVTPPMFPCWCSWVWGAESTGVPGTLKAGLYETSHLIIYLSLLRLFTFAK